MNNFTQPDYTRGNPYKELYIYYLAGRVQSEDQDRLENFIGNWEEDGFSFLFFSKPALDQVNEIVKNHPELSLLDDFHMNYEEWQGAGTKPLQIGRFLIQPPWMPLPEELSLPSDLMPIKLDPGVVFGTGTHATTRDCIAAVSAAMETGIVKTAVDLGTGTGLLALAAARYGCRRCLAVDLNPLASRTASLNVRLNQMDDRILVVQGRADNFIDTPADLLIANIHYEVMRQLVQFDGFFNKKLFVLSGLTFSEATAVRDYLSTMPVKMIQEWSGDGIWHTFLGAIVEESQGFAFY